MSSSNPVPRRKRRRCASQNVKDDKVPAEPVWKVVRFTSEKGVARRAGTGNDSATLSVNDMRSPAPRPPESPFYPEALPYWVFEDNLGVKSLVKEMVPGCRHWRIGDPNVDFCVECSNTGGSKLLGCHTCKRAYHEICLNVTLDTLFDRGHFYCPLCLQRGWNVQPPEDILPQVSDRPSQRPPETPKPPMEEPNAFQSSANSEDMTQPLGMATLLPTSTSTVEVVRNPQLIQKQARSVKRRSRYQTVSDEVDQAMSTIYRELEYVAELKTVIDTLREQLAALQQERQMHEGQVALEREDISKQAKLENDTIRDELVVLKGIYEKAVQENQSLKEELQQAKSTVEARTKELEDMKAGLRRWLDK